MSHAPVLRTLAALLHYPGESLYDAIDALAAGFGVSLGEQPLAPALVLTTAFAGVGSILCFFSGRGIGQRWERGAHWIAGLVLIALGTSIVTQHLRAA